MLNLSHRFASISLFCILSAVSCTNTNIANNSRLVQSAKIISGKVEFPNFKIKATINEIAPKATVSLLYPSDYSDPSLRNVSVATGLTNVSGQFSINTNSNFSPIVSHVYVLEAVKRIGGAGNNVLTLRTHLKWNGSSYESITTPGIYINTKTTALSIISSLGGISANDTIGKMPIENGIVQVKAIDANNDLNKINLVKGLVEDALTANNDPVGSIISNNGQYSLKQQNSSTSQTPQVLGCIGEPAACPTPTVNPNDLSGCIGDPSACSNLTMNAGLDFSPTINPNGVWSYGSYAPNGNTFTPFNNHRDTHYSYQGQDQVLQQWYANNWLSNFEGGSIWRNPLDQVINIAGIIPFPVKQIVINPGRNGAKGVLRLIAPSTKLYHIQVNFKGLEPNNSTTTDVHIMKNAVTALFNGFLNVSGQPNQASFTADINLNQNDTLDFTVGDGNVNEFWSDETAVDVIITSTN